VTFITPHTCLFSHSYSVIHINSCLVITDYVLGPGSLLWVEDVAVDHENKTPCHHALKERTHRDTCIKRENTQRYIAECLAHGIHSTIWPKNKSICVHRKMKFQRLLAFPGPLRISKSITTTIAYNFSQALIHRKPNFSLRTTISEAPLTFCSLPSPLHQLTFLQSPLKKLRRFLLCQTKFLACQ